MTDKRFLETRLFVKGQLAQLEELGIETDSFGDLTDCILDLWDVVMVWRSLDGKYTLMKFRGDSEAGAVGMPYEEFLVHYKAAQEMRQYVVVVEEA